MKVYEELNMKEIFLQTERKLIAKIEEKIQKYSDVIKPEIYTHGLETVKYHINR